MPLELHSRSTLQLLPRAAAAARQSPAPVARRAALWSAPQLSAGAVPAVTSAAALRLLHPVTTLAVSLSGILMAAAAAGSCMLAGL